MIENKVLTKNSLDEKLVGLQTLPDGFKGDNKYPTIILVHGFGVTKEEGGMFDDIAEFLAKENFLVYRFDFSGRGESDGDYLETSLSKLKTDLESVLDFVKSEKNVDISKIGILGQSLGTSTTITLEPDISCLVMMGSVSTPQDTLVHLFGEGYNPKGISVRKKDDGSIIKVGPQFWEDFDNHKLLESIRNIKAPILFIHGSADDKVPVSNMEAYFDNANEPKEKVILDGADHGLRPKRSEMQELVLNWFKGHLI